MTIPEMQQLGPDELIQAMGPAGMAQRYREWQEHFKQQSAAPGYMCDIDHHPKSKGSAPGHMFPVQLCHGHILKFGCSEHHWQIATGKEHMVANGCHALDACTSKAFALCPLVPVLDSLNLTAGQLKTMSGNGMNLLTQSSWMTYVMSHVIRIDQEPTGLSSASGSPSGDDWLEA